MIQKQIVQIKLYKIEQKLAYLNNTLLDVQQIVKHNNKINHRINNNKNIIYILLTSNYYWQVNLLKIKKPILNIDKKLVKHS